MRLLRRPVSSRALFAALFLRPLYSRSVHLGVRYLYTNCLRLQYLRLVDTNEGNSQVCAPLIQVPQFECEDVSDSSGEEGVNRVHTST